ncbi:MAG: hypothetical protein COS96_02920 [Candidatus Nealsonbacteria bacterium CG07_land_8_20_14_0_80_39_13]|nr:MAG: hypothetical protein COS96_02920 [Candidatus Nealsonbacteria bacterium CG07_land_8_20_14_0_80_39_13]
MKTLKFLSIICFILALFLLGFVIRPGFFDEPGIRGRDAKAMSDLEQIGLAMEMYFDQNDKYIASSVLPKSVGIFLNDIPESPKNHSYNWINNIEDDQRFCVRTEFESGRFRWKEGIYYIFSNCGTEETNSQPKKLDDCCETKNSKMPKIDPSERGTGNTEGEPATEVCAKEGEEIFHINGDEKCCLGLKEMPITEGGGGICTIPMGYICIAFCGNGKCEGEYENKCSCPKDCK